MQHLDTSTVTNAGDDAAVHVQIEWKGKELPQKWEKMLEQGLQTVFNKTFQKPKITVKKMQILDTPFSAKIIISPSKGEKSWVFMFLFRVPCWLFNMYLLHFSL